MDSDAIIAFAFAAIAGFFVGIFSMLNVSFEVTLHTQHCYELLGAETREIFCPNEDGALRLEADRAYQDVLPPPESAEE